MMRVWVALLRGAVQVLLAPDVAAAKAAAEPEFDDEQPDETYDVTDRVVTAIGPLVALLRDRAGRGAEAHFRYDVNTCVDIWLGADPPDEWRDKYLKECEARNRVENDLAEARQENAAFRAALPDIMVESIVPARVDGGSFVDDTGGA